MGSNVANRTVCRYSAMKLNENRLWKYFSLYIRVRDARPFYGTIFCITCGAPRHYNGADCGHGVSRRHMATKYDERNNHAQCKTCNGLEGGRQEDYAKEVDKRYGPGTWDAIVLKSRELKKYTQSEIDELADHYKKEYERIKTEKHI